MGWRGTWVGVVSGPVVCVRVCVCVRACSLQQELALGTAARLGGTWQMLAAWTVKVDCGRPWHGEADAAPSSHPESTFTNRLDIICTSPDRGSRMTSWPDGVMKRW